MNASNVRTFYYPLLGYPSLVINTLIFIVIEKYFHSTEWFLLKSQNYFKLTSVN